jgi:hypothetical protein
VYERSAVEERSGCQRRTMATVIQTKTLTAASAAMIHTAGRDRYRSVVRNPTWRGTWPERSERP